MSKNERKRQLTNKNDKIKWRGSLYQSVRIVVSLSQGAPDLRELFI